MEQLQNLATQYALGMRRLEEKEEREKAMRLQPGGLPQPASSEDELKRSSWRVLVTCMRAGEIIAHVGYIVCGAKESLSPSGEAVLSSRGVEESVGSICNI